MSRALGIYTLPFFKSAFILLGLCKGGPQTSPVNIACHFSILGGQKDSPARMGMGKPYPYI